MAEKCIVKYPNGGATSVYYRHNVNNTTDFAVGFVCKNTNKGALRHLLEHCLFHGIPGMSRREIDSYFRSHAVDYNAYTTQDCIMFTFNTPNAYLRDVVHIVSAMFAKDSFDDKLIESEKEVVKQERRRWMDGINKEDVGILDYLYNKTTYGTAKLLGSEASIDSVTAQDMLNYKKKYFVTENLIVSVVSSLPYKEIKPLIEENFINKFPSKPKYKTTPKKRTYNFDNQLIELDNPYAESFKINFIFKGLQNYEKNELYSFFEDWYFNDLAGKLAEAMRHEYPLTYSPRMYNFEEKDIRLKVIDVTTSPEYANDCIYLTAKILSDAITKGISEQEFEEFQQYVNSNRERKTQIKSRSAENLFDAMLEGYNPFVKNFYEKTLSLTREDINKYLHDVYAKSKLMLGYEGNIDYANAASYINEPYNVLSTEYLKELYFPLYSLEEVLLMYKPMNQLKAYIEQKLNQDYCYRFTPKKYTARISKKAVRQALKRAEEKRQQQEQQQEAEVQPEEKVDDEPIA